MEIKSVTFQPATEDTYINATSPTTNYASATSVYIGSITNGSNMKRILLRFSGLSNGTIPKNAIVVSAVMSFFHTGRNSSYDRGITVYRCLRNWVVNQATWNIYSTGNSWDTAGGWGSGIDRDVNYIGFSSIGQTDQINVFKDVILDISKIQEMVSGSFTDNGFIVDVSGGWADEFIFASSDNATSANRPKLTIGYIVPNQLQNYRRSRVTGSVNGV